MTSFSTNNSSPRLTAIHTGIRPRLLFFFDIILEPQTRCDKNVSVAFDAIHIWQELYNM